MSQTPARDVLPVSGLVLLSLAQLACAPMYRPDAVHSPMLEQAGDLVAAGGVTYGGAQGGVAVAKTQHLAFRTDAQLDLISGPYVVGTGGVGYYRAAPGGFRLGLWLDAGGGWAQAQGPNTYLLSGTVGQLMASAELGWQGPGFATGLELRGVEALVLHDAASTEQGLGHISSAEALVLVRLGPGPLTYQLSAGLSIPFYGSGNTGVQMPLILGLGVVWRRPA